MAFGVAYQGGTPGRPGEGVGGVSDRMMEPLYADGHDHHIVVRRDGWQLWMKIKTGNELAAFVVSR